MRNCSAVRPGTGSPFWVSTVKKTATLEGRAAFASSMVSLSGPPQAMPKRSARSARSASRQGCIFSAYSVTLDDGEELVEIQRLVEIVDEVRGRRLLLGARVGGDQDHRDPCETGALGELAHEL